MADIIIDDIPNSIFAVITETRDDGSVIRAYLPKTLLDDIKLKNKIQLRDLLDRKEPKIGHSSI